MRGGWRKSKKVTTQLIGLVLEECCEAIIAIVHVYIFFSDFSVVQGVATTIQ